MGQAPFLGMGGCSPTKINPLITDHRLTTLACFLLSTTRRRQTTKLRVAYLASGFGDVGPDSDSSESGCERQDG